jgi:putative heme-binding domain-containing protein
LEDLRGDIEGIAGDGETSDDIRASALLALGDLGGEASARFLEEMAAVSESDRLKSAAVAGLASVDLDRAAKLGAETLVQAHSDRETLQRIFTSFLQKSGGGDALKNALAEVSSNRPVPQDTAKLSLRYLYSIGHQDPDLLSLLTKAAGIMESKKDLSPEEMEVLIAQIQKDGDPAKGEQLFRRADLSCLKCHGILGAGGTVAPDLAGLGASAQLDYLIESILQPGKAVREGYAAQLIDTVRGDSYNGTILRETENEVVLRDQIEDEIAIPKEEIVERRDTGSLMPQGIADLLTREELVDLVRFVSELGKPGAYETRNVPVVRRWRSVLSEEMAAPGVPDVVETPLYSLVSGDLPLEGLPTDDFNRAKVRCEIEVTTPGRILFKFNNTDGLRMWIDNEEIEPHGELVTELDRGKHSVLFQIKLDKRKAPLRLEVTEAPDSEGRVQVVSGR